MDVSAVPGVDPTAPLYPNVQSGLRGTLVRGVGSVVIGVAGGVELPSTLPGLPPVPTVVTGETKAG